MKELPYSIHIPAWNSLVVHAGIIPSIALDKQTPTDLVTLRNIVFHEDGTRVEGTSRNDIGEPWVNHWQGDATALLGAAFSNEPLHIVFGHDARRGLQQGAHFTGLDTGCAYGRQLSALILPERRLVQVPAREVYSPVDGKD